MSSGVIFWLVVYLISTVLFFSVAVIITIAGLKDLKFLTKSKSKINFKFDDEDGYGNK